MMKIGKNVYITNNLNYQRYEVNCIPKGDCVIFISYSGETKTLINMAKTCQKKNIPFLSLTSFGENTLSQMSDAKLYISTRENLLSRMKEVCHKIADTYRGTVEIEMVSTVPPLMCDPQLTLEMAEYMSQIGIEGLKGIPNSNGIRRFCYYC